MSPGVMDMYSMAGIKNPNVYMNGILRKIQFHLPKNRQLCQMDNTMNKV